MHLLSSIYLSTASIHPLIYIHPSAYSSTLSFYLYFSTYGFDSHADEIYFKAHFNDGNKRMKAPVKKLANKKLIVTLLSKPLYPWHIRVNKICAA